MRRFPLQAGAPCVPLSRLIFGGNRWSLVTTAYCDLSVKSWNSAPFGMYAKRVPFSMCDILTISSAMNNFPTNLHLDIAGWKFTGLFLDTAAEEILPCPTPHASLHATEAQWGLGESWMVSMGSSGSLKGLSQVFLDEGELNMIVFIENCIYMYSLPFLFICAYLMEMECRSSSLDKLSHLWKEGFGPTISFHLRHSTHFVFPNKILKVFQTCPCPVQRSGVPVFSCTKMSGGFSNFHEGLKCQGREMQLFPSRRMQQELPNG